MKIYLTPTFQTRELIFRHAGCDCPEGFRGRHCEVVVGLQFDKGIKSPETVSYKDSESESFFASESNSVKNEAKEISSSLKFLGVSLGVLAIVVLPIFLMIFRRSKKTKSRNNDLGIDPDGGTMTESYRDSPGYSDNVDSQVKRREKNEKNIV